MRRSTRLAPLVPALLCLGLGSPAASAEEPAAGAPPTIYKWVDANGVAHYTTDLGRVPRSVRGSVRALGGGGEAPEAETDVAHTPPPATPSPDVKPAEPLPEWDVGDAPPSAPAPRPLPPRATGKDRWAEIDRPQDGGPAPEPAPGAVPAAEPTGEPGAEPTQTAAAEPVAPAIASDVEGQRRDLDARIASLQEEISADEDALKGFLAVATPKDPAEIAYDASFREVAERLPKRLAELRSLQSERAQLDTQ